MTEEEAKTKWCPFARVLAELTGPIGDTVDTPASFNRRIPRDNLEGVSAPGASRCIGADCMAWRDQGNKSHCGLAGQP